MAKLKVFLDGQMVGEHPLSRDHEFIAGRGESCDCVLRPERGISRQHFRIKLTSEGWKIESLSRYGELYFDGEKTETAHLTHGRMFTVPPYEFIFEESEERMPSEIPLPQVTNSRSFGGDDRTVVGAVSSQMTALMRLIDYSGQTIQTFSLQGLSWVGGRDIGCSIFIDNPKISRRQFEMQKVDEVYFIRDLESVNGTIVNGQPIPSDSWTQLNSSDVISIADWSLIFEIRDVGFEQRVREIDPAFQAPVAFADTTSTGNVPAQLGMASSPEGPMPALSLPPRPFVPGEDRGKRGMFGIPGMNPIRMAIIVTVLFGGLYYYVEEGSPEGHRLLRAQTPFDKLPPEKQQLVKQAYQLARDLYTTGKYELANQKIDEIHAIIPYYEDSKELQKYVDNAIQVQRDRERLILQQEEERKRKDKVEKVLVECRKLVEKKKATIVPEELEACLAPALEFDPENLEFKSLRAQVEQFVLDRKMAAAKAEDYKKQVARRKKLYDKARSLEKKGRSLAAIEAYGVVVDSKLPDPNHLTEKSKKRITSLRKSIAKRQEKLRKKAEAEYKSGNRREAILLLRKALKINPRNSDIEDRIGQIMAELRKDMQAKYQESILEESVGSVAEAKKKWLEIQKTSVSGEDYYEKAKIKLKKYGELMQ